jgi:glucokinase
VTGGGDAGAALVPVMDVGGTHVTAALVDIGAGAVIGSTVRRRTLRPSAPAEELLEDILGCGRALPAPAGAPWGVAVPGPFDYDRGVAFFAGVGKFESLYGTDVGQALRAGLPGPAGSVRFLNDADAFLLGEWLFGAAAGHDPCAAITLGTGVGSAFLSGGVVRQDGPGVPPEGRVDLLSIDGQPLEDVVSTRAIERRYQRLSGARPQGAGEVAGLARGGDPVAAGVLRSAFEALGKALSPWLEKFGAEALVVGGSMTGSWDLIGPALVGGIAGAMADGGKGLRVVVAAHPEHAALLGAGAYAEGRWGATRTTPAGKASPATSPRSP